MISSLVGRMTVTISNSLGISKPPPHCHQNRLIVKMDLVETFKCFASQKYEVGSNLIPTQENQVFFLVNSRTK